METHNVSQDKSKMEKNKIQNVGLKRKLLYSCHFKQGDYSILLG